MSNERFSRLDDLTEQQLAEFLEANKDDDSLWQPKGRRVRNQRKPSTVFQMRIAPEDLEEIAQAAGGNVSEFIRTAALEKARASRGHRADAIKRLREQVNELAETVERL